MEPSCEIFWENLRNIDQCTRGIIANAVIYGSLKGFVKKFPNISLTSFLWVDEMTCGSIYESWKRLIVLGLGTEILS